MKFLLSLLLINTCFAANTPSEEQILLPLGHSTTKMLPEKNLKLLVWNLHKGENKDFKKDFSILSKDKDLILAQEIYLDANMRESFAEISDFQFLTATSFLMGKDLLRTGIATGTAALIQNAYFVKTIYQEPVLHSPKMSLFTQYKIENHKDFLTVINIHGINFVNAEIYRQELQRILDEIIKLKLEKLPLIIAGDFNSWSLERLNILNNFKAQLNVSESNFSPDNRLTFRGFPLDHVLYSHHLELVSAKAEKEYKGSDHQPLELIFDVLAE